MVVQAFLAALAVWIGCVIEWIAGYPQTMRPIVMGPLVGLALGDLQTGILIGAQLEAIFLGVVAVGGSVAAETATASGIGVGLAVIFKMPIDQAIAVAIPVAYIGVVINSLQYSLATLCTPLVDKVVERDNYKLYTFTVFGLTVLLNGLRFLGIFFALVLGGDAVVGFINGLPSFVMSGITAAGAMLPAVGMAVLLSMLWNNKMALYFLLGFSIIKYLDVPILFVAIIAVFLASVEIIRDMDLRKKLDALKELGVSAKVAKADDKINEKEGFFS